jgi:hypothetical protein
MKRQVMILLVLTIFFCTLLPAQAANLPPLTGVQFFPADHIWNVRVDTLPVDPKSGTYINAANSSAYLYMHRGFFYNIVDSSTPKQYMTSIRYAAVSDNVPVPIPEGALVETASSDHQMDIVDKDSKKYYQIFDAHKAADGTWSCGSLAVFDLTGYTLRPDGWSSDEAGLPALPGTLRYDEVASGEINHALRVGLWRTQNAHIWPARFHSGLGDTTFPPMGQRFRLKASVDISKYTPQQQVILKALKKYGMMVATNTGQKNIWALAAITDSRWDTNYASFSGIKASDFEAVDVSSLMINKDSGKARTTTIPTPAPTTTPSSSSSITLTSPNGGESWQRGTLHTVTWNYLGDPGSAVKIAVTKAGTEVGTIAASAPLGSGGKGSYSWTVSPTGSTGSDYKVSIQSISKPTIKDLSNNYFTLTPAGAVTPSVSVTSPNGGESWVRGSSHTITWSSSGTVGSNVKIEVLKAGVVVQTLSASTPNDGSFSWTVSTGLATGSDYRIRITSTSTYTDSSNSNFTITTGTTTPTTPSLTVTSPNGGEVWYKYTTHAITWSYAGSPGPTVKIVLLKGGTQISTIAGSVPVGSSGKGSYSWFVPTNLVSGSDYKVSVQSVSQPTIQDSGNANFKISWA